MAYPGEEVVFQPISAGHLFEPESLHVFVDHDCHTDVATFTATKGHFVQGESGNYFDIFQDFCFRTYALGYKEDHIHYSGSAAE